MSQPIRIKDILSRPGDFVDSIVNLDGLLLVGAFHRAKRQFRQVWILQADGANAQRMRALPIHSDSTLWHGLSRLDARHLPGYQQFRIHDKLRACVRVVDVNGDARLELLTAALFREAFTLFVGESGVRLEQALPANTRILSVHDIRHETAPYLNRVCRVYGTLTIKTAPLAQYLAPGRIAYIADRRRQPPTSIDPRWLADIIYPQSDNRPQADDSLADALHIDGNYRIARQLRGFPGINQTSVKPAIIEGKLVASGHPPHFAGLTDIRAVYLQNIRQDDGEKAFESVLKLKRFAPSEA